MTISQRFDCDSRFWRFVVALCAFAAVAQTAIFFPGYLSFDSAHQWWQARHNAISTLSPPGQVLLLRALALPFGSLLPGGAPTALYALNIAAFWACVAYVAVTQRTRCASLAVLAVFACCPTQWIILPHVWSDVTLAVCLMLVCVLLDASARTIANDIRAKCLVLVACVILVGSALLRHNAVFAIVPLAWWASVRWRALTGSASSWGSRTRDLPVFAGTAALLAIAISAYLVVPRWVAKERADTWAITLIWDLQAMSVRSGQVLVPPSICDNATLEDLRQSFDPVFGINMYVKSKARWVNAATGLAAQQRSDLLGAWAQAAANHPSAYLRHRWHVFINTLGPKANREADGSADEPMRYVFNDNPRVELVSSTAHTRARQAIAWLKPQLWASPLAWIVISSSVLLGVGLRSRASPARSASADSRIAAVIWLSAMFYLVPLFIALPSSEMRYVLWPTLACVLSACIALRGLISETNPSVTRTVWA